MLVVIQIPRDKLLIHLFYSYGTQNDSFPPITVIMNSVEDKLQPRLSFAVRFREEKLQQQPPQQGFNSRLSGD